MTNTELILFTALVAENIVIIVMVSISNTNLEEHEVFNKWLEDF